MSGLRFSIREIFLVTLIVALLVTWGAQTYLRQWPTAKEKALMQERLEALKLVVEMQRARVQQGVGDFRGMHDAQVEALAAELELCTSHSERHLVLKKNLETQQQYEKIAAARFDAGGGTQAELLVARADRLNAEIALERAKTGR